MAYWMSFNCLYSAYDNNKVDKKDKEDKKKDEEKSNTPSEVNQIKNYIKHYYEKNKKFHFNAFDHQNQFPEILRKPIIDAHFARRWEFFEDYDMIDNNQDALIFLQQKNQEFISNPNYKPRIDSLKTNGPLHRSIENYTNLTQSSDVYKRTEALFLLIYQIRCNLFHGKKSPEEKRDFDLVVEAAYLMENYMDVFLKKTRKKKDTGRSHPHHR